MPVQHLTSVLDGVQRAPGGAANIHDASFSGNRITKLKLVGLNYICAIICMHYRFLSIGFGNIQRKYGRTNKIGLLDQRLGN